ncbi:MAG: hypothetical protein JOZ73_03080, partial [Solirubrobacterales bacterium]|nr:hypothetical protein [Solirubrobacterales bacterium]
MSDPAGVPSGVGIDSVEWLAEGDQNVTVRVTGRWRRRRPIWVGQPLLVIEVEGHRYRFPAMAEPPGVTGAAPGTWQMTFSVPSPLAAHAHGGNAWLKLGIALLRLPIETPAETAGAAHVHGAPELEQQGTMGTQLQPPGGEAEPDDRPVSGEDPGRPLAPDADTIAQRQLRSAELALQASRARVADAQQRADELASRVEELEDELAEAEREPERLSALLSEGERRRRMAEQRAYAERALREGLAEKLADRERELRWSSRSEHEVAELHGRVAELADELEEQRRRADEAEQLVAAARVARTRAEQQLGALRTELGTPSLGPPRAVLARRVRAEHELVLAAGAASMPPLSRQPPGRHDIDTLDLERAMAATRRGAGERIAELERVLDDQKARMKRAHHAVEAIRLQFAALRLDRERELLSAS